MNIRTKLFLACSITSFCCGPAFAQSSTPIEPAGPGSAAPQTTQAPAEPGIAASPGESPTADQAATAPVDGDIVVTAQRRNESLQRAAVAITALSGDALTSRGVVTVAGLQNQVPGLQIAPQVFGNLQIFLRGVGSTSNTESGDAAIAFNIDGVFIARTTSTAGLLFDLDRVEVVKGPQGTLYGRNATGGSINVITKKPTFDGVSGYAAVDLGNYQSVQTEGAINVPLSDTLAARLSYKTARHDGYLKVVDGIAGTVGNDRQDQDDYAVRLHLLYKPTDRLSVLLSGDYSHQGGAGGGEQILPLRTGDPRKVIASQYIFRNGDFANASLTADYDLGFAKLTYIGAYRYSSNKRKYEYPLTTYPGYVNGSNRQWTHELRLGGDVGGLTWVAGYYHFDEKSEGDLRLQITPTLFTGSTPSIFKSKSDAFFGQVTYSLTDRLRVTGGLRYTWDDKSLRYEPDAVTNTGASYLSTANGTVLSRTILFNADGKWKKANWKAGFEFDVAPRSLFYGSVGTAYKSGGNFSGSEPNTFGPENLTAYEIGLKNRLLDNRLTLNLAAYWYDYTDLQVSSLDTDNGTPRVVIRNAGSATIKGLEAEATYNSETVGRFDGSFAYTDAKYDTFVLPAGDSYTNFGLTTSNRVDYSGNSLPFASKFSFNAGYQYSVPAFSGDITARVQTHFESGKYLDFHHFDVSHQGSYTKSDLSMTYQPANAAWSLQAYVRNIEGNDILLTAIPPVNGNPIYAQAAYAPPRTYGGRLSVTF